MQNTISTQILKLREKGYSYNKIIKELGCSRSLVSYYCGEGQKEKTKKRGIINRETLKTKVSKKVDNYLRRNIDKTNNHVIRDSLHQACYEKVMNTTHCYLTGRLIDLNDISSYSLDHIVPFSKSLDNSVNNLGVCCRDVNKSKSDLSIQEYVALCKEVVEYYN